MFKFLRKIWGKRSKSSEKHIEKIEITFINTEKTKAVAWCSPEQYKEFKALFGGE
jgi:hypothetical protein